MLENHYYSYHRLCSSLVQEVDDWRGLHSPIDCSVLSTVPKCSECVICLSGVGEWSPGFQSFHASLSGMVTGSVPHTTVIPNPRRPPQVSNFLATPKSHIRRYHFPRYGTTTPSPENLTTISRSSFRFETGYALQPKRLPRPFPPPFISPPSSSFSDPLTTHSKSQDRRLSVKGELIRGLTNGDDAILAAENCIGVNDGVGAWATKPHGHAA
jgi:hypothetical protein